MNAPVMATSQGDGGVAATGAFNTISAARAAGDRRLAARTSRRASRCIAAPFPLEPSVETGL